VIVSGDDGFHIESRALKLGIQSIVGVKDKKEAVLQWCEKHKVAPEQAVFIGNDENDIEAMGHVGLRISPADAPMNLRSSAHLVLTRDDSYGIMRKVHDYFFKG
jgi:N-acylneuraminate cytidylyltransferase